jgi:hypothetical protein
VVTMLAVSIRAYGRQSMFEHELFVRNDCHASASWTFKNLTR